MTFWEDLMKAVKDEPVEAVEIVDPDESGPWWDDDDPRGVLPEFMGVALRPGEARALLDYSYDSGYGGQDCHNVHVWTPTRVISIHEYDGATWPIWVPRNPPAAS